MAVIPHPPYNPDLAPCDFFLFSKMKLELKGRRFYTIEEIKAESQRVLDTDRKGLPGSVPKMGDREAGVSMKEKTTSRVMAADRPYLKFSNFYSVSTEYFGYNIFFHIFS
jgi:hypothetical protein